MARHSEAEVVLGRCGHMVRISGSDAIEDERFIKNPVFSWLYQGSLNYQCHFKETVCADNL